MDIEILKGEALKVWVAYGEAIKKVFGFEGNIIYEPLKKVTSTEDEERITQFISYVKEKIEELKRIQR